MLSLMISLIAGLAVFGVILGALYLFLIVGLKLIGTDTSSTKGGGSDDTWTGAGTSGF